MTERKKDLCVTGLVLLVGIGLGALAMALFGCGQGPGYLGAGLILEDLLEDDAVDGEDGLAGLACYDLNANGECDEEEDADGSGYCDVLDCHGPAGADGDVGPSGPAGETGLRGPPGPPGISPPPVVIVIPPVVVPVDDEDDEPPHGNAWGSDGPHGNPNKP